MIVTFTTPAMGHLKPMLPVLRGLVGRDRRIVCYGHASFEGVIAATGAEFRPYPAIRYDVDRPDFNLVRMAADIVDASGIIIGELLPEVASLAPRLILQDSLALWGGRIGTALGVPRVHTVTTILFDRATVRAMCSEDGPSKLARDVATGFIPLARALTKARFAVTPAEAFGLPGSWRRLAPPVREIVLNLPEVQGGDPGDAVPRTFVGPPLDDAANRPSGYPPGYVLVTFGSLSNTMTARFEAAMRGALAAGLPAVVLCGGKVDVGRLRAVAADLGAAKPGHWAEVVERVPKIEPVIRDAAAVVNHAGTGSAWEAAFFRKPALYIPTIADQMVFASRLERLGIGRRLPRGSETEPAAIAEALKGVMALRPDWDAHEALRARAGGAERAIDIILEAIGEAG
jgi:MGT family glycosyltransferase